MTNIMIDEDDVIKIVDFGFSTFNKNDNLQCGTPYYLAPEIWCYRIYDNKVDMWSLGVLLYYMLNNLHPFIGRVQREIYFNIIKHNFNVNKKLDTNDFVIIHNLLIINSNDRISIEELLNLEYMQQLSISYYEYVKNSDMNYTKKNSILSYINEVNNELLKKK